MAFGSFVGMYNHSLDPKKRITIPSDWREQIGKPESVYVMPSIHSKCLMVCPAVEMARRIEKLRQYSVADARARQFARILASQSELIGWDVQGRIRIKDPLLNFAGLSNEIVLTGAYDFFELWNPEEHSKKDKNLDEATMQDMARYVGF